MKEAKEFLDQYLGYEGQLTLLPQSGSARKNYIAQGKSQHYILTQNENILENDSFLYFSEVFSNLELNTPKILSVSQDRDLYLQEYLGKQTLFEYFLTNPDERELKQLGIQVLDHLYKLQMRTQGVLDYSKTFEYEKYNELPIQHDLNYFKFLLVDLLELPYHKSTLLLEFKKLSHLIESLGPKGIMIRDFQSRNIILGEQKQIYFIDYQSAMHGPLLYDVVSFLYQAKAPFSPELSRELLDYYLNLFQDEQEREMLKQALMPLRLIRALQVLGAYGLRGIVQGKSHFMSSLEKGIQNAIALSNQWDSMDHYPELHKVILALGTPQTQTKIKDLLNRSNKL